jgi:hypothetical protein
MITTFNDFNDRSVLESIRKLKLIKKILKMAQIKSELILKGPTSYIYVNSTTKDSDIKGIMIYPIGNKIAFRVRNSKNGLPQGRPKLLDFEKKYSEIYSHHERNKEKKDSDIKSASKVVDDFIDTIKNYFKNEFLDKPIKDKGIGLTLGTDYSSMVYSKY